MRVKYVSQMEHSECGLACVSMILNFHGFKQSLSTLRDKYGVPTGGYNLLQLKEIFDERHFISKGLGVVNSESIPKEIYPCIAFWNNNHFVVLEKPTKKGFTIVDPAKGRMNINNHEFDQCFSKKF